MFRRSGGIPFVVEELVRCCGADACIDDLKTAQLPWSLDEAVRQQLAGLSDDERRVVDALAVFGDPAPFEVLRDAVRRRRPATARPRCARLVDKGIVVEPSDDTFWFGHALVADAVQQQLLGRERRSLHERSLEALRAMPEPDHAALARHALGAGKFDLIPAIAREGARRYLDRGASFQALRLASEALAEAPNDPELLGVATDAAWRLEFGAEAMAYASQWRANAVTDLDRVESLRFIARLHHELLDVGQRDATLAELESLADQFPAGMASGRGAGAVAQLHMLVRPQRRGGAMGRPGARRGTAQRRLVAGGTGVGRAGFVQPRTSTREDSEQALCWQLASWPAGWATACWSAGRSTTC